MFRLPARLLPLFAALVMLFVAPAHADGGADQSPLAERLTSARATKANKSPVRALMDPLLDRYAELGKVAASTLRSSHPETYAANLYLLEHSIVNLMTYASSAKGLTDAQRQQVTSEARSLIAQVQWNYRTLLEEMRTRTEKASPGTSGTTLVEPATSKNGSVNDLYSPSYKGTSKLTKAESRRKYDALRAKHEEKYPGSEPHFSLDKSTLGKISSGELLEWVQTPGGHIRVTRNAKHAVMAGGNAVRSAGALKVFWGEGASGKKEPLLVMVSNWSGTYQPDMASVSGTMMTRLRKLGVPQDRIVMSPAMPLEPKVYEVLLASKSVHDAAEQSEKLHLRAQSAAQSQREHWTKALSPAGEKRQLMIGAANGSAALRSAAAGMRGPVGQRGTVRSGMTPTTRSKSLGSRGARR